MPKHMSPWIVALGVMMLGVGCRGADPSAPVDGHRELCCRTANPDNVSFAGCRVTSHCRANEEIWLRGPVTCGPADPQACAGGRCCALDLEGLVDPEPSATPEPADQPKRARAQAPAPVRISPIPLDWRATPVVVAVPKFVCPASGTVSLRVEVGADGRVGDVEVRDGFDPQCDALAREALLHAEFEPARTPAGEPIPSTLSWSYRFEDE